MSDRVFETVNYYKILGLEPEIDPVRHKTKIKAEIEKQASAGSSTALSEVESTLVIGLKNQMTADLETPEIWIEHQKGFIARRRASGIRAKEIANKLLDHWGDAPLSLVGKKTILRAMNEAGSLQADADLAQVLKSRNIKEATTTAGETKADRDRQNKLMKTIKNVQKSVKSAVVLCNAFNVDDIYQLASVLTDKAFTPASTDDEMRDAKKLVREKWFKVQNKSIRSVSAAFEAIAVVFQVPANATAETDTRRVFDDLFTLERTVSLLNAVTIFKYSEDVRSDAIDRMVAAAAAKTGLSKERIGQIVEALLLDMKVKVFHTGAARDYKFCTQCGAIANPDEQTCHSCKGHFLENCARCDAQFDRALSTCPGCGLKVADGRAARAKLDEAETYLAQGDVQKVKALLPDLNSVFSRSTRLKAVTAGLRKKEMAARNLLAKVNRLQTVEKKPFAAFDALNTGASDLEAAVFQKLASEIRIVIDQADKRVTEAAFELDQSKFDAAKALAKQALAMAADHPRAQSLLDTIPPEAPHSLKITKQISSVRLSWKMAADKGPSLKFLVVRNTHSPPENRTDGVLVTKTSETTYQDFECPSGVHVYYAVFASRGSALSMRPALAGPVRLLAPVQDLQAHLETNEITLRWTLPKGAHDAEIRRVSPDVSLQVIPNRTATAVVTDSWVDRAVETSAQYRYHVCARYVSGEQSVELSVPSDLVVTVPRQPSAIEVAEFEKRQSVVTWSPSGGSAEIDEVLIFDKQEARLERGATLSLPDLKTVPRLGHGLKNCRCKVDDLPFGTIDLVVIRTIDQMAMVGPAVRVDHYGALKDVRLEKTQNGATLSWLWPDGCQYAEVETRLDQGAAQIETLKRAVNEKFGAYPIVTSAPRHVAVEIRGVLGPGEKGGDTTKVEIHLHAPNTLEFDVKVTRSGGLIQKRTSQVSLHLSLQKVDSMPELAIRFSPDYKPGLTEGELLKTLPAETVKSVSKSIDLTKVLGKRVGYINVIPVKEVDRARLSVIPLTYQI